MKKIGIWNNYECFAKNQLFNIDAYGIGEDLGYPFILLKEKLAKNGYLLETLDMSDINEYEKLLFIDYPASLKIDISKVDKLKKILFLTECLMLDKNNADIHKHARFQTIYTYDDNFVKKYHYKKMYLPNKFRIPSGMKPFSERNFCTLIASNKMYIAKGELYSQRIKTIRCFEKSSHVFDLYGRGWEIPVSLISNRWINRLKRVKFFENFLKYKPICYKGSLTSKIDTLSKYQFCICYENTESIPGYITEKIFDCFFAGVIPVYWGAPNITDYIPANCFIDRRLFKTNKSLLQFLQTLTIEDMEEYLKNIIIFLQSPQAQLFSAEYFTKIIIGEIIDTEVNNSSTNI